MDVQAEFPKEAGRYHLYVSYACPWAHRAIIFRKLKGLEETKSVMRRLVDYPDLWAYTRDLYQTPGVADTVNLDHIKRHYYRTHRKINPTGVVPRGPAIDYTEPHDRAAAVATEAAAAGLHRPR